MILLFLSADDSQHWWQADASGRIVARGAGTPPADQQIIAVPPPDAVSLHRIQLPRLATAQAQAASRLMASELCAAPIDTLHTAISVPDASGRRWLAMVGLADMTGWQRRLAAQAIDAPLVPAALLLPVGTSLMLDAMQLVHLDDRAFAAEPELAALMLGRDTAMAANEADLARPGSWLAPPLDLRQGRFASGQRFTPEPARVKRLVLMAAAGALMWVAGSVASWWQASSAADAAEAARDRMAVSMLPPGAALFDARGQVGAQLARVGSGAVSRLAAPLLAAMASRPGISLAALTLDGQGLTATLEGASPGDIVAIETALRVADLTTAAGLPREVAGRRQLDLKVGRR